MSALALYIRSLMTAAYIHTYKADINTITGAIKIITEERARYGK